MMMLSVSLWMVVAVTLTAALPVPDDTSIDSTDEDNENMPMDSIEDYDSDQMTTPVPEGGDDYFSFTCPDGWMMYSSQCLLYVPQSMSWTDAKENCQSLGGSLAAVFSDAQSSEIYEELTRVGATGSVWVGGYKSPEDSTWTWDDYSYFNGVADFCDQKEHENNCLELTADDSSACLDDLDCDAELPSVCGEILM